MKTNEADLLPLIGLDATVFLRILRMCRNIFVALTVVGCGILIPINLFAATKYGNYSEKLAVEKVTPMDIHGKAKWGMTVCAWLFNIIVAGFLWWNYRVILKLRRGYFDSPEYQAGLHARTLMVSSTIVS
jgi:hypothetical protein